MKRRYARLILAIVLLLTVLAIPTSADKPVSHDANGVEIEWENSGVNAGCTRIQDGILETSDNQTIETGFDVWGYNYQAHMFNGLYCDSYRDAAWCQPYKEVNLMMKWNDAWLANNDCDNDGLLDRHYGFDSYIGSGAWLTNHQSGTYLGDDELTECNWNYFVKIVAVPADATSVGGLWYAADGTEIGEVIWGAFAIIQQVENDACAGINGLQYNSPDHAGFGGW